MHGAHSSPAATLSDLISRRMQTDLVENSARNNVPQALRTLSSMSPIAPKQSAEKEGSATPDTPVDISIARTAGNLPPWHQYYRAGPSELLAVPCDKMQRPAENIPEDIAPFVHLSHLPAADKEKKRPVTAKYLPTAEEGRAEDNEVPYRATEMNKSPRKAFLHIPNQTPPPYAVPSTSNKVTLPESPSSAGSDNTDHHGVISHLDRDTKAVPLPIDNAQIMNITRTVLANRVPAPPVVQPSYFDRPTSSPSTIPSGIIPVNSKPEPASALLSTNFVSLADQHALQPSEPTVSPGNIVEIVSVKNPRGDKPDPVQEPEPLSVLIQKAILRQHKEQLEKAPDKMAEITARAQQMKGAYDIESRPFQPTNVLTPGLGQTSEKLSSVTFSDSGRDIEPRAAPVAAVAQTSTEQKGNAKSKRRPNKKRYPRRSSSTESSSSSYYYYSSYSESSEERVKWLSLGKDLANYPLYVTKYAHCGKCQHKGGNALERTPMGHESDSLKYSDRESHPNQSPSVTSAELQLNYLHRNPLDKVAPRGDALEAPDPSPQLIVYPATLPSADNDKLAEEIVHAHQITRLKHTVAQKKADSKDVGSHAKEIIVTAVRRGAETASAPDAPISDNLAHASNQNAPALDLNYNISGFVAQDPDSVDYNEVLFVLSRERGDAQIGDAQNSTPRSIRRRLPPRAAKNSSPSMLTPAYNSTAIRQEAPRAPKATTPPQMQSLEKQSADSHEEIQAVLAHPFRPSGAPIANKPTPKTPSDLSYLSCINNVMEMHSVSAVSDTPERFQHYHNDSSIMAGPLQHSSSYLSPDPHFYIQGGLMTPDMREETFSNLEEGEIPQNYQYIHGGFTPPVYTYISQNNATDHVSVSENEQEVPSLVELANCSLTPEEDLVLAKAMEALNV